MSAAESGRLPWGYALCACLDQCFAAGGLGCGTRLQTSVWQNRRERAFTESAGTNGKPKSSNQAAFLLSPPRITTHSLNRGHWSQLKKEPQPTLRFSVKEVRIGWLAGSACKGVHDKGIAVKLYERSKPPRPTLQVTAVMHNQLRNHTITSHACLHARLCAPTHAHTPAPGLLTSTAQVIHAYIWCHERSTTCMQ